MVMSNTHIVPAKPTSGIAVAGFVLAVTGVLFFMVPVLSLILLALSVLISVAALVDTKRNGRRGYGLAVAGTIISVAVLASAIVLAVIV